MKIAIISDIHGNLEALKATIKDIENYPKINLIFWKLTKIQNKLASN